LLILASVFALVVVVVVFVFLVHRPLARARRLEHVQPKPDRLRRRIPQPLPLFLLLVPLGRADLDDLRQEQRLLDRHGRGAVGGGRVAFADLRRRPNPASLSEATPRRLPRCLRSTDGSAVDGRLDEEDVRETMGKGSAGDGNSGQREEREDGSGTGLLLTLPRESRLSVVSFSLPFLAAVAAAGAVAVAVAAGRACARVDESDGLGREEAVGLGGKTEGPRGHGRTGRRHARAGGRRRGGETLWYN
ncbi:hypothetical protein EW146_g10194, partial [Bondarzewia mesenterica]